MFEVVCTGKNENYGKKGEKRLLNDTSFLPAIKNGWIYPNKIKFVGSVKDSKIPRPNQKEKAMPIKWINVERTLKEELEAIKRVSDKLDSLVKVNKSLLKLIREAQK